MAIGTGGPPIGPGGGIPFSTEWLAKQKAALRDAGKTDATEKASEMSDASSLSSDAKKLSSTKDERMLKAMRTELSQLDTESETFMQEATEKLIGSVIDQEYGEHFKGKPGFATLQEKITQTVLDNPESREALSEFFELLLMTEPDGEETSVEDDSEDEEGHSGQQDDSNSDDDEHQDHDEEQA